MTKGNAAPRFHADRQRAPRLSDQEFIRFLNAVEREVPAGKTVHAILDNYVTHKHPKVIEWLGRHPRWTFHFTPTSASWLNAVEGFFAIRTKRRLKRGVFKGVVNACLLSHRRRISPTASPATPTLLLSGEDLSNVGPVALGQDLAEFPARMPTRSLPGPTGD